MTSPTTRREAPERIFASIAEYENGSARCDAECSTKRNTPGQVEYLRADKAMVRILHGCRAVPVEQLIDGERYLVQSKHGMIEGRWNAEDELFEAYYWRDMSFYGEAFTIPTRSDFLPASVGRDGLRQLLDAADDALDKDTYDEMRKFGDIEPLDEDEICITVGTRAKINALILALDRLIPAPPGEKS